MKPDQMTDHRHQALLDRLLAFGKTIDRSNFFPAVVPGASSFALANPFAFLVACCFDRQLRSEVVWAIPFDLARALGHLEPARIAAMSLGELAGVVGALPRKPRYPNAAPRTLKDLSQLVVSEGGGNAASLWEQGSSSRLMLLLRRIHGVGPGIASMTPLLVEKAFGISFPDLEHATMDIKADVHTMRVLHRLGVAATPAESSAIAAARTLNPKYPGELDAPLWSVGKRWCAASSPSCSQCIVTDLCARVGV